jgi:Toprim domain
MSNLDDFIERYTAAFDVAAKRFGREWRVPCPIHEADGAHHNPSLAIWSKDGVNVSFHCMVGCKHADITMRLADRGVLPAQRKLTLLEASRRRADEDRANEQSKRAAANYVTRSKPLLPDGIMAPYLASRGLVLRNEECNYLRIGEDKDRRGCNVLIGVIVDPTTLTSESVRAVGITVTMFLPDGRPLVSKTSGGKSVKQRRIIGKVRGCGVPLGTPSPEMVVGEGIESTLSAMRLLDKSFGIATLSAQNIPALALPSFVRKIWIAADNDEAGQSAAFEAALHWRAQRYDVLIRKWGDTRGWDANDELMAQQPTERRT